MRLRANNTEKRAADQQAESEMWKWFEPVCRKIEAKQAADAARQELKRATEVAAKPAPTFRGYQGDVDELIDENYSEPDAGARFRDSYVWVGDEFRRICQDSDSGTRMDFSRAKTKPPTPLAVMIAEFYGAYPSKTGELLTRLASFAAKQHAQVEGDEEEPANSYLDGM